MSAESEFGLPAADRPMFLVSTAREILLANPAALAIFGASLETEMVPLAKILPPENAQSAEQLLSDFEKIPPVTALKFRAQDGSTRIFSASICPFKSGEDVFFIFQLFPETVPAELADDAVLAQRQKLDCALQLARSVVLDFNNALTSILGHTSLLLGKAEADHPWRRSLIEVEKSAARAAEIANELAVFSRHEKEARRMPPRSLNVITQRCVDFFRSSDGAKVSWKIQLERELFGARFDEAKLQQALTKILENAVEAVARIQGQIVVQTRNVILTEPTQDLGVHLATGNYVAVEISDNGGGIEPEDLPRIFEPFFTKKRAPHRGLGLALVYGIVANHGGGVAVSSRAGAGTSARIYLPAEKKIVREIVGADSNLHGTETVLVVDDEIRLLTMSEMILSDYGYNVLTAGSGEKALAILAEDDSCVDLVVTDLVMPGMGGRELVERIRQIAPRTRILCTSGYVPPADKQSGTQFLQKPFTSAGLLARVKRALAGKAAVD